jgi:hypothetical protein
VARNLVTVFLSTGRCGTQWAASALAGGWSDCALVDHEPLGPLYASRLYYRQPAPDLRRMLQRRVVSRHLRDIESLLRSRHYIETGWPLYAAMPLFAELFGDQLRVVNLVRHPIPVGLSLLTHRLYRPGPRRDDYARLALLDGRSGNVIDTSCARGWAALSSYEKCLWWWAEIQSYSEELERCLPAGTFLRCRLEDLVGEDRVTRERLVDFTGFPPRDALENWRLNSVDSFRTVTDERLDHTLLGRHPNWLALMRRYGYAVEDVSERELELRYLEVV